MGVVDGEAGLVEPFAQVVAHAPLPRQLFEQRLVLGDQPELAVDSLEPHSAVTAHQLAQVGGQVRGKGKLGVGLECLDHLLGGHAGGGGVPQRERRQAIGVNVLGALLQLGERRDRVAGLGVQRVVDLQQDRAVPLHDQRIGGIVLHGLLAGSRAKRADRISLVRDPLQQNANAPCRRPGMGWQGATPISRSPVVTDLAIGVRLACKRRVPARIDCASPGSISLAIRTLQVHFFQAHLLGDLVKLIADLEHAGGPLVGIETQAGDDQGR